MEKKQQAQRLYMDGGKTQKEIADIVGVSERTVPSWVHQYAWHKLRLATLQAPITIADNLCSQLVELQNTIAAREPGKRYPTMEEAEITRKLIVALEKVKKYPSLSMSMQVLETFRNYIRPIDKEFTKDLARYTDRFLTAESINGFAPYQVEYGVSPASPFYSESDKEDDEEVKYCNSMYNCPHPPFSRQCVYPKCKRPDPEITYAVPDICYHPLSAVASAKEDSSAEASAKAKPVTCHPEFTEGHPGPVDCHSELVEEQEATGINPAAFQSETTEKEKKLLDSLQEENKNEGGAPALRSRSPLSGERSPAATGRNPAISQPETTENENDSNSSTSAHTPPPSPLSADRQGSERAGERSNENNSNSSSSAHTPPPSPLSADRQGLERAGERLSLPLGDGRDGTIPFYPAPVWGKSIAELRQQYIDNLFRDDNYSARDRNAY